MKRRHIGVLAAVLCGLGGGVASSASAQDSAAADPTKEAEELAMRVTEESIIYDGRREYRWACTYHPVDKPCYAPEVHSYDSIYAIVHRTQTGGGQDSGQQVCVVLTRSGGSGQGSSACGMGETRLPDYERTASYKAFVAWGPPGSTSTAQRRVGGDSTF